MKNQLKKHRLGSEKRKKLIANILEFIRNYSDTRSRDALKLLIKTLTEARFLEDLEPYQLRMLIFLGKWKYEKIIEESDGLEGLPRARMIMKATCWKQHYESIIPISRNKKETAVTPSHLNRILC